MTVSFLLQNYTKMLKNGLNSGVLSTATIKLRKLEEKKLTRHKLSNKQSFKLFGRSEAQKARGSANRKYNQWSKNHNINNIKTLADYYNVKYNDHKRYTLLKQYTKSIDIGMLSPLTGFDKYEEYHARIQTELFGITTANGITIKSQSAHFLERVFGTKEDPKTLLPRNGVALDDIHDALISDKNPKYSKMNDSFIFTNHNCQVSVNPDGNLVQTNSKKEKNDIHITNKSI